MLVEKADLCAVGGIGCDGGLGGFAMCPPS